MIKMIGGLSCWFNCLSSLTIFMLFLLPLSPIKLNEASASNHLANFARYKRSSVESTPEAHLGQNISPPPAIINGDSLLSNKLMNQEDEELDKNKSKHKQEFNRKITQVTKKLGVANDTKNVDLTTNRNETQEGAKSKGKLASSLAEDQLEDNNKQPVKSSSAPQTRKRLLSKQERQHRRSKLRLLRINNGQCEYIKGPWQECQRNGIQQRVLKLSKTLAKASKLQERSKKSSNSSQAVELVQGVKCDLVRIIRRECNTGCKYLRGQWSAKCVNGHRLRIDTLIGPRWRRQNQPTTSKNHQITSANSTTKAATIQDNSSRTINQLITCQPQRKVVKDCKRTCHYIKSEWSECVNGFKRRTLQLDERPLENLRLNLNHEPATTSTDDDKRNSSAGLSVDGKQLARAGLGCAKTKIIRRVCRATRPKSLGAQTALGKQADQEAPSSHDHANSRWSPTTRLNDVTVDELPTTTTTREDDLSRKPGQTIIKPDRPLHVPDPLHRRRRRRRR